MASSDTPKEHRKPGSSHKSRTNGSGKSNKTHDGKSDKKSDHKHKKSGTRSSSGKDKKATSSHHEVMPESQSTVTWAQPADITLSATKLGEGSQGTVYTGTFRQHAIAVKKLSINPDASKFAKEVEALVTARHAHIVLVICACATPGNLMIGFELVERGNLKKLLEGPDHPTIVEKFKIAHTITLGLNWIHRNLVHGNLSTSKVLITSDFTAKLCGFGISGGEKNDANWNWKNPDEKESIAHDTYSLGLVLWSLFQPKDKPRTPFKEYGPYDAFVAAVRRGARPSLENTPSHIEEICKALWAKEPASRPKLETLKLFDVMVDATLPCPTARAVWRETVKTLNGAEYPTYVPMHMFLEKLYQGTGEDKPLPDVPQYRCLERMFGVQIAATGGATQFVKLERFSQMISWFGPLKGPRTARSKWIATLESLMRQSWFHGESTKDECDRMIAENKKLGSYLVRISSSSAPEAPFTLAKMDSKAAISNLRIYATDTGYYCQSVPNVVELTVPILIEKLSKQLHLKHAIEYQPFLVLFETTALAGCYGATSPSVQPDLHDDDTP